MTSPSLFLLPVALAIFVASVLVTWLAERLLLQSRVMDRPNARSSHSRPVTRGGGVGFVAVALAGWAILIATGDRTIGVSLLFGGAALAAVSFVDDVRGVSVIVRLAVQAFAVFAVLALEPAPSRALAMIFPEPIALLATGLIWLWFINLFNFMDGIDGLAAGGAVVMTAGVVLLGAINHGSGIPTAAALVVGAAVAGFLPFNLSPARIFMGDVGSTQLGFLIGWLLLSTAGTGFAVPAVLLPLYFVADSTSTLAWRAWRRERLHEAHQKHAYQRAVGRGLSHGFVAGAAIVSGMILLGLALAATIYPYPALAAGVLLVLALIVWLRQSPARRA